MLNEQPPERRRVHPLEQPPAAPPPDDPGGSAPRRSQQVTLRIPSVRPYATYILIGINLFIFAIRAISPDIDVSFFDAGANNQTRIFEFGEFHRLFTSMFLHASVRTVFGGWALENSLHVILNCYIIYITGTQIERLFGHVRFILVYLLGGVAGSILSALLNGPLVYSVGASGAAFALLGAQFAHLYQHRTLLGARGRAQMQQLISLAVINLVFGLVANLGATVRIDNWGHIGGAMGGLALGFFIGPFFIVRRHPEQADALIGEDINPLRSRLWVVSLYCAVLIGLLIVGSRFIVTA